MVDLDAHKDVLKRISLEKSTEIFLVGVQYEMNKALEDVFQECVKKLRVRFDEEIEKCVHETVQKMSSNYSDYSNQHQVRVEIKKVGDKE